MSISSRALFTTSTIRDQAAIFIDHVGVIGPWSLVIGLAREAIMDFSQLKVYQLAEKLADEVWDIVIKWSPFEKFTVGRQMVNAADSIGSNIAEGEGRGSYLDNRRFVRIARGSLNETRHWLRRANSRKLLTVDQVKKVKAIMDELGPKLNAYLNSIGKVPVGKVVSSTKDQ